MLYSTASIRIPLAKCNSIECVFWWAQTWAKWKLEWAVEITNHLLFHQIKTMSMLFYTKIFDSPINPPVQYSALYKLAYEYRHESDYSYFWWCLSTRNATGWLPMVPYGTITKIQSLNMWHDLQLCRIFEILFQFHHYVFYILKGDCINSIVKL